MLFGIALGAVAYCLFTLPDATAKFLVTRLPVWEVLFFRSLFIIAVCGVVGRTKLLVRALATPLKGPLALRGAITLLAWLAYFTAAKTLPFAQLTTLYFGAPILVMIMAAPLLGERVSRARWSSVGLGFAGVVIAADPGGLSASYATALVILAAALWAYAVILMRQIATRESSIVQVLYQNLFFLAGSGVLCAIDWTTPTSGELPLLLVIGICGGIGQFLLMEAARHTPASVMATVEYSSLLWAFVLGFAIWGDIPAVSVFMGAAAIIASGGLLVAMERRAQRAAREPAT
ncbi:MAG: DMT family transporter [Alphaproteobacteria bacterium]|nr:DMT family transporter [Alphaproteobacteria bacterium]